MPSDPPLSPRRLRRRLVAGADPAIARTPPAVQAPGIYR